MGLALILFKQVLIMLIFLCVGVICFKTKLITKEGNKSISNLVLYIINPVLIFISYQQDFSVKLLKGLGATLVLTILGFVIFILISNLIIRNKEGREVSIGVERFSVVYSNCGFMGIPIASVLFGAEGVFYITAFNTIFNIMVWSHGVLMISGNKKEMSLKKVLLNPTIIATALGLVCFILKIRIPEIPHSALTTLSGTIAPMAMLVAGVTIAQTNLFKALQNFRIYIICALKLLVLPILCLLIFKLIPFNIDETVLLVTTLALCCPTATMGTMFAIRFDKNAVYAAEIFAVTTIISIVTMPLVIYIQQILA
ncbi:MAG: AEC family transporter [Clostridiales bacterium]|nr:AEC family transporter [Clostridiales bacterium]